MAWQTADVVDAITAAARHRRHRAARRRRRQRDGPALPVPGRRARRDRAPAGHPGDHRARRRVPRRPRRRRVGVTGRRGRHVARRPRSSPHRSPTPTAAAPTGAGVDRAAWIDPTSLNRGWNISVPNRVGLTPEVGALDGRRPSVDSAGPVGLQQGRAARLVVAEGVRVPDCQLAGPSRPTTSATVELAAAGSNRKPSC